MRKWLRIKLKIWYDKEGKKYKKLKGKSNGIKGKIKWIKYPIKVKNEERGAENRIDKMCERRTIYEKRENI